MTQRICRLLVLTLAPVLLSNFAWAQAINLVCSHRYGDAAYILDIPKQTVRDVQRGLQPTVIRWDDGVIVTERKLRDVATKPPLAAVEVTHFNRLTAGFSEWTELAKAAADPANGIFGLGFAGYRFSLVAARKYPPFKALLQVALAACAVFCILFGR